MYGFKNGSPFSKQHLGSRALDSSQLTISRDVLHKQNTMPEGDAPQEGNQQITKNDLQNMLANLLEKANENTKRMLDDRIPEEKSEKRRKLEKVKLTSKANQQQFDYQGQVVDIFEKAENSLRKQKYDEVSDLLTKATTKTSKTVVGKILEAAEFWKNDLQASPFVLSIIENGYRIPFKNKPTSFFYKNNLSSFKNYSFTTKAIIDLIDNDCISEIREPAYCCNPLTVAEKNGKLRLV
uniref:Uncharacterized protein n=1 Tax=Clytia hemisphaerica TaxID=252671 RepID=A0A7M5USR9_9CNID